MNYHGQMALQIAILVAFTQLIPEHQVQILGVIKTRVKVRHIVRPYRTTEIDTQTDAADGLSDLVNCPVYRGLPMSLDYHTVWLVCWLDLFAIL